MATVLERVQKIVAERLGVDESAVVPEASFTDDLEADSLDLVDLILAFQDEFSTDDNPVEILHLFGPHGDRPVSRLDDVSPQ